MNVLTKETSYLRNNDIIYKMGRLGRSETFFMFRKRLPKRPNKMSRFEFSSLMS